MRIGLVGINHKNAGLGLREKLAKACSRHFQPCNPFHHEHSFVLLSTCNRTEVYFCSEDLALTHSFVLATLRNEIEENFEHKLYSYFGKDCFLHLTLVTAGIDSAIAGETEIQGQVKGAYQERARRAKLPHELHFLFQKSLKIGKDIRSKFQLGRGMPDIEHSVFTTGLQEFGEEIWQNPVLFVGASAINQKICQFLSARGIKNIHIINRSNTKAQLFCQKQNFQFIPWNQLHSWHSYRWIIVGTKATEPILYLNKKIDSNPRLVIDLSVPRNVDAAVGKKKGIILRNIDQINRHMKRRRDEIQDCLEKAEVDIAEKVEKLVTLFYTGRNKKKLGDTTKRLTAGI